MRRDIFAILNVIPGWGRVKGSATGIQVVEARNGAKHGTKHCKAPQQRIIQLKMSILPIPELRKHSGKGSYTL